MALQSSMHGVQCRLDLQLEPACKLDNHASCILHGRCPVVCRRVLSSGSINNGNLPRIAEKRLVVNNTVCRKVCTLAGGNSTASALAQTKV